MKRAVFRYFSKFWIKFLIIGFFSSILFFQACSSGSADSVELFDGTWTYTSDPSVRIIINGSDILYQINLVNNWRGTITFNANTKKVAIEWLEMWNGTNWFSYPSSQTADFTKTGNSMTIYNTVKHTGSASTLDGVWER